MIHITNTGYLSVVLGPMFSGKTSRLVSQWRLYQICDISCCIINYDEDKRYHDSMLSTHDHCMVPCLFTHNCADILTAELITNNKVFFINEAQFFNDLYECVVNLVEVHHKTVYIYGLDGDFQRIKFGNILELIPLADEITKCAALCKICKNGTKAIFSHRLSNETAQKVIGANNYIPICRKCYQMVNQPKYVTQKTCPGCNTNEPTVHAIGCGWILAHSKSGIGFQWIEME